MEWISCLSEAIVLIWIVHKLMHRNFCLNCKLLLFLLADVVIFWCINASIFPSSIQIVVYIFLIIYVFSEFKDFPLRKIIENMLVSVFVTGGIEIVSYLLSVITPEGKVREVSFCIIMLCLAWVVMRFMDFELVFGFVTKNSYVLRRVSVLCGVLFVFVILIYKNSKGFSLLNCLLISVILLIVLTFFQQWKIQKEMSKYQERELRVLKQSKDSFEHLINDVQARQHEFNNQIETLYSMHYVYNTYEELVERQKEYITNATDKNHFNKLLTANCSPVIKGFLYYKFEDIQQQGTMVDYQIDMGTAETADVEFDILECIGILLDNAREALCDKSTISKINFILSQRDGKVIVQVENPAGYLSQSEISMMTMSRYSTKGDGRGYGLHNIKMIAKRHKGTVLVENKEKAGQNWVSISLELCNN